MNGSILVDPISAKGSSVAQRQRVMLALAICSVLHLVDAKAVPITTTSLRSGSQSVFAGSANTNRYSDFSLQESRLSTTQFAAFDSSLGTLLSADLLLVSSTGHPTSTLSLPDVSGRPTQLPFGALAQDTERDLHGPLTLWAYYDAQVSYRSDYRLTVDPTNTDLFSAVAAEAAFGSCSHIEDLFGDIGETNPYCMAGNNGSPLGNYSYSWGPLSGATLSQFVDSDLLNFNIRMTGDAFGHCDDDVGDYCRVNLGMTWDWNLLLSYTYEPLVPGTGPGSGGETGGGGGGGNPVPVPEPTTLSMMAIALFAVRATRKRRNDANT